METIPTVPAAVQAEPAGVAETPPPAPAKAPRVGPQLYLNRDLGQLAFTRRVLAQAENRRYPLLERLKFLCIVSSNLDEFFEIRVAGLHAEIEAGTPTIGPERMRPAAVYEQVANEAHALVAAQYQLFNGEILPQL